MQPCFPRPWAALGRRGRSSAPGKALGPRGGPLQGAALPTSLTLGEETGKKSVSVDLPQLCFPYMEAACHIPMLVGVGQL